VTLTGSSIKIIKNLVIKIILIVILFISIGSGEPGVQANGGNITRIDFAANSYTEHWLGFYGIITNNTMTIENFNRENNNSIKHIFLGISVYNGDYLIITTSSSPPDLFGLRAGNIASINEITGLGDDSGSNTFTNSSTYRIPSSGDELTDVPSISLLDSTGKYSREALFADINGDPVFAVPLESRIPGKNDEPYYFQIMLPDNGSLTYYFFYLQSDI
jgi:hypothetical protein